MINLFSIGIGVYSAASDFNIGKKWADSLDFDKNLQNLLSHNNQIFDDSKLTELKNFCQNCIDDYHNKMCHYPSKLKIVSSWLNKNLSNQSHHMHKHQNAVLTGVFYLDDIDETPITFYNPALQNISFYEEPQIYNDYNSYSKQMVFKKNTCIIFPSYLFHSVAKNETDNTRYTIAFNAFYESNQIIGNRATELKL